MISEDIVSPARLACAAIPVVLNVDVDRVLEIAAELFRLFLLECILGDDCLYTAG